MMNLQQVSKRLRAAADAIDALLEVEGTAKIAKKIVANLPRTKVVKTAKRKYTKRATTYWKAVA
jgi:hypothetical protein